MEIATSQFTKITTCSGGYDERFIGYGLEDLDFNVRSLRLIKESRMDLEPSRNVYHVKHVYEVEKWKNRGLTSLNSKHYKKNRKRNIIELPVNENWGRFNT